MGSNVRNLMKGIADYAALGEIDEESETEEQRRARYLIERRIEQAIGEIANEELGKQMRRAGL